MTTTTIPDRVTSYAALIPAPVRQQAVFNEYGEFVLDADGNRVMKDQIYQPAGVGNRARPGWDVGHSWRLQLAVWGLPMDPEPLARRVWEVTTIPKRGKIARSVPSGKFVRVFEDGRTIGRSRPLTSIQDGPLYELPFADARALWRDVDVCIKPAVPFLGNAERVRHAS